MLKTLEAPSRRDTLSEVDSPRIENYLGAAAFIQMGMDLDSGTPSGESLTPPVRPSEILDQYVEDNLEEMEYIVRLLDASKRLKGEAEKRRGKGRERYQKKSAIASLHADELIARLFDMNAMDEDGRPAPELLLWRSSLRDGVAHAAVYAHVDERKRRTHASSAVDGAPRDYDARERAAGSYLDDR